MSLADLAIRITEDQYDDLMVEETETSAATSQMVRQLDRESLIMDRAVNLLGAIEQVLMDTFNFIKSSELYQRRQNKLAGMDAMEDQYESNTGPAAKRKAARQQFEVERQEMMQDQREAADTPSFMDKLMNSIWGPIGLITIGQILANPRRWGELLKGKGIFGAVLKRIVAPLVVVMEGFSLFKDMNYMKEMGELTPETFKNLLLEHTREIFKLVWDSTIGLVGNGVSLLLSALSQDRLSEDVSNKMDETRDYMVNVRDYVVNSVFDSIRLNLNDFMLSLKGFAAGFGINLDTGPGTYLRDLQINTSGMSKTTSIKMGGKVSERSYAEIKDALDNPRPTSQGGFGEDQMAAERGRTFVNRYNMQLIDKLSNAIESAKKSLSDLDITPETADAIIQNEIINYGLDNDPRALKLYNDLGNYIKAGASKWSKQRAEKGITGDKITGVYTDFQSPIMNDIVQASNGQDDNWMHRMFVKHGIRSNDGQNFVLPPLNPAGVTKSNWLDDFNNNVMGNREYQLLHNPIINAPTTNISNASTAILGGNMGSPEDGWDMSWFKDYFR